jgi:hypothetical protein
MNRLPLLRSTSALCGRRAMVCSNTATSTTTTTSSWFSSTTTNDDKVFQRTVYVHPLSQIVLEYFQDSRSDWVHQKGLERSLVLHRDGSFEIQFASNDGNEHETDAETVNKIWTSYDEQDKKHWLAVQKGPLHERFLLQDNLASAWHANRLSLPERIQVTVDEMIRAIDRMDGLEQDQQGGDYPK